MIKNVLPDKLAVSASHTIETLRYSEDVICKYEFVQRMMPQVWSGQRHFYTPPLCSPDPDGASSPVHVDLALHMGMDPGRDGFSLETRARRDGYAEPGEDDVYLSSSQSSALEDMPAVRRPSFDLDSVRARVALRVDVSALGSPAFTRKVLTRGRNRYPSERLTMQGCTSVSFSCTSPWAMF